MKCFYYNTKTTTQNNTTQNIQQPKFNTHVQREVELSSPEPSMMKKRPKQQSAEILTLQFMKYDPINAHIKNTDKIVVALQPKPPLHYVVYPI